MKTRKSPSPSWYQKPRYTQGGTEDIKLSHAGNFHTVSSDGLPTRFVLILFLSVLRQKELVELALLSIYFFNSICPRFCQELYRHSSTVLIFVNPLLRYSLFSYLI